MIRMRFILSSLLISFLFLFLLPSPSLAATFRSGETISITEPLDDLYVAGQRVTITAPIGNDLMIAGEKLQVSSPVSNEVFAAGRSISLTAPIGNTLRAAGETINLSAPVKRDVILFGSMLVLDQEATVSGDLIANGETILIQSPVSGDVIVNGKHVTINNVVSGNVSGHVDELILGSNASISGNLDYTSENRAVIRDGATIGGQEQFHRIDTTVKQPNRFAGVITQFALYKLIADILLCLALIFLAYTFTARVTERGMQNNLKLGALGFGVLVLGPITAIVLLILLLPGVLVGLLYAVLLLLAAFISKILVGRMLLTWWYARQQRIYVIDWKAAVVGPLMMFLLLLIPFIGWLIGFGFFLLSLGSLTKELLMLFSSPSEHSKETPKVKRHVAAKKSVRSSR